MPTTSPQSPLVNSGVLVSISQHMKVLGYQLLSNLVETVVCPELSSLASISLCNRSGICERAKCAHPLAECRVNPCTCQAEFVDKWGRQLQCDKLPTKCQHEAMEKSVMADIYHPQCEASGKYSPQQCFADHFEEKCWCVDDAGNILEDVKFNRDQQNCCKYTHKVSSEIDLKNGRFTRMMNECDIKRWRCNFNASLNKFEFANSHKN